MRQDEETVEARVSVIVPTIGRPESLRTLLASLKAQTRRPQEVIVADGSSSEETERLIAEPEWMHSGLRIRHIRIRPPNAVRQRVAAIREATGDYFLLLDDDIELDPNCIAEMVRGMRSTQGVVAIVADFSNERWSGPTRAWRLYLRVVLGIRGREWEGRVLGPLLRFGFPEVRAEPAPMEWIGAGTTLVLRKAYERCGGFSDFFLHRSTMNEDVDLGLKLGREGAILFWPSARLAHHHEPSGRVSVREAAEDDVFNRYWIMVLTQGLDRPVALRRIATYVAIETVSSFLGGLIRLRLDKQLERFMGRMCGMSRIAWKGRVDSVK